jgi:WD40 repeat protein
MLPAKAYRRLVAAMVLLTLLIALVILSKGNRGPTHPPGPEWRCTTLPLRAGWIRALAFSPDGTWLAIGISNGDSRGEFQLWDVTPGGMRAIHSMQIGAVTALCFSRDGRLLATGNRDGTMRVWDVASGARQTVMQRSDPPRRIVQLAFSPDSQTLAGGSHWAVALWDVATGRERVPLPGRPPLTFSPDGKTLATARTNGPGVQLWDVDTGKRRAVHWGESPSMDSLDLSQAPQVLAYSRDWSTLATGEYARTIFLWDVARLKRQATLAGHEEILNSLVFAPDGRTVATASNDRTVKWWEVTTGRLRATFEGHTGAVYDVAFSPDGQRLASGGFDQTVRLWDLDPERLEENRKE